MDQNWIDDRSEPEVEFKPEVDQTHEQELTNFRVLEWLHDLPTDPRQTILTIQDVDNDGIKYVSHGKTKSNLVAPDGPLRVPQSNLDLLDFVQGVGVGLTHTKNLIIQKLNLARETRELETEGENAKKPPFGRIFESYFDLLNHYSNNIVITDSDFILTKRTCAIAITADVSFKTALEPESLVLALTRLKDFLVERGVTSLSLPVYDPNREKLHPRELYALVHVIFSETDIEVYLHKKYYLRIC